MSVDILSEVVRKKGYLGAAVGEEQVLLDMEHGVYIGLNPVGSDIWRRIEQPKVVAALCEELRAAYDAEAGVLEADVLGFLDRLLRQDMIELRAAADS
ncbi:PqqD family protein [Ancylobacter lacus]|uniref:PqqD family protein n=1 Tax=Ancylobacter lacus TaxID=2579970 RepID=UPI001BCBAB35|nr:PqqD family protein [Ancylobacter lacus]MBS7538159.1 PqqD family protein [Ancylobacter lacus]